MAIRIILILILLYLPVSEILLGNEISVLIGCNCYSPVVLKLYKHIYFHLVLVVGRGSDAELNPHTAKHDGSRFYSIVLAI